MFQNICRLCLCDSNLVQIFVNSEQSDSKTVLELELTTGLKIEPNDGYSQNICHTCRELVNSALNFRHQCRVAHTKLIQLMLDEKSEVKFENNPANDCETNEDIIPNGFQNNLIKDCSDNSGFTEFEIEIQCDRLTEEENGGRSKQNGACSKENGGSLKQEGEVKFSRKKARETYMELVDGVFEPNSPVKCKVCKKTVKNWACFVAHAKLHMPGKKVVCEYCGKGYISKFHLRRHYMTSHGMARELACKHCGYLALDNAQLLLHERRAHTGDRPFVCDTCSASYHSRRCLLQHIDSHRKTATVQCEQCPKKFRSTRELSRHRYKVHVRKRKQN